MDLLNLQQSITDIKFNPPSLALSFHADKKVYNENGKYVKEIVLTCTMPYPGYGEDKTEIDSGPLIVTVTSKE